MSYRSEAWMADALCAQVDGDLWYPEAGGRIEAARRICMKCPVREACLDYALRTEDFVGWGVWGGLSERERRKLKVRAA